MESNEKNPSISLTTQPAVAPSTTPIKPNTLDALRKRLETFLTRTSGEKPVSPIGPMINTDTPSPLQETRDNNTIPQPDSIK